MIFKDHDSDEEIKGMVNDGMDGIEVLHPSHSFEQQKYFHQLAKNLNLLETGGSDYHGTRKYDDENFSKFTVPYSTVENIKEQRELVENLSGTIKDIKV